MTKEVVVVTGCSKGSIGKIKEYCRGQSCLLTYSLI